LPQALSGHPLHQHTQSQRLLKTLAAASRREA